MYRYIKYTAFIIPHITPPVMSLHTQPQTMRVHYSRLKQRCAAQIVHTTDLNNTGSRNCDLK